MADFDQLLLRTSRTFALSIPKLPDPPRREVGIAYLLFRIADTFEDAWRWPRAARLAALSDFSRLLRSGERSGARELSRRWAEERPCDQEGYLELLRETPAVLAELDSFAPSRREAVVRHTLRTAEGMAGFVERGDEKGNLRLKDVEELRRYCYAVAGIVGELLTELFLDVEPKLRAAPVAAALQAGATAFGEGLQLVNILKDSDSDAREGRVYLPAGVDRDEIFELAERDLDRAADYVRALQQAGAPRGFVEFTALPVLLARASLQQLEKLGPGSKVSRAEVALLIGRLQRDLDAGAPVLATTR